MRRALLSRWVGLVVISEDWRICGQKLPAGLRESERLPNSCSHRQPKAEQGEHDEPISIEEMRDQVGSELTDRLIDTSFALFRAASEHAESAGIILCDTKFEFGNAMAI